MIKGLLPIRSKNARVLILGSMPGEASLRAQQYYAHPHNAFWKIMTRLLGPAKSYKARAALLKKHRIALWDVIARCERKGSLDSNIKKAVYNPLGLFLKEHSQIRCVLLNGGKAQNAYRRYAKENGLELPFICLPSTSPAHTLPLEKKLKRWKVLTQWCRVLVFIFGLQASLPAFAAPAEIPPTEALLSKEYGKLLWEDTVHVLSAPARWDREDWLLAGLGTGAVVLTAAYADEPVNDEIRRNKTTDKLARIYGPFGYEYIPIILGAFEAKGFLFEDERAKQVAHDGIASSLIATGLITGSLKLGFGRSRPFDDEGVHHFEPFSGNDSFPSGHTTQAFALATVISEHYDPLWVKFLSYGTATMVGYSRMETGSHWLSDALAGAIIGTVVGKMVVGFNKERRYELSPFTDGDSVGLKASRTF